MPDNNELLTICIPTYNRPDKILNTVKQIVPQLRDGVKLNILDDCSPKIISKVLEPYLSNNSTKSKFVNLIRHPHNIGCGPNIIRSFEICQSEWLWVPGDDDEIKQDAIDIILRNIKEYPDVVFMNFSTSIHSYNDKTLTTGRTEMLNTMEFGNVLFMTSGIYKAPKFQNILQIGYQFQQTNAPHTAILISAINDDNGDKILFSSESICEWYASPVETHGAFLREHGLQKVMIYLLDLSISHSEKKILADKMLTSYIGMAEIFISHYHKYTENNDRSWFKYQMSDLCNKAIFFDTNKKRRLLAKIYRFLSSYPMFIPFVRLFWRGFNSMLKK